jgi:hypothetical protein
MMRAVDLGSELLGDDYLVANSFWSEPAEESSKQ